MNGRWLPWLVALPLLAGCGAGREEGAAAGAADPVTGPAPRPAQAAPAEDVAALEAGHEVESVPSDFSLGPRAGPVSAHGPTAPVLVAVRSAEHDDYDRVVFEFQGQGLPQWRIGWVLVPITDCAAGQVVPVSGTAWLQVRFSGAAAHTPEGQATSGPRQRRLRHPVLRDLARTCDFEGEVTWVAGLAGRHPYRVQALQAPARLVLDIAH